MRKLLSQKVALAAKSKDKPYQIHDATIPGLVLRVQPTGTKIWKLVQNHKPRTLGRFPVMTFGMARGLAEAILRGEDPDEAEDDQQEDNPQLTFDEFLDNHYERYARVNFSSPDGTMGYLRRFGFGDKKLDEIRLADLKNWQIDRQELNRSPETINREVATIKSALQYAVDSDLLDKHPLKKLKPLKTDKNPKPRYLSPNEEKQLTSALVARDRQKREQRLSYNEHQKTRGYKTLPKIGIYADNLTPLVLLAINTGLRRGELWNLVWGDIDMKLKRLTVHGKGAKSGQTRHVQLNVKAIEALKTHRGQVTPMPKVPVFGGAEFRKAFVGVLKAAKIDSFRFHDTRHTFASKLVMAGVPLNTVRELLGHASLEMTLRYAHLAPKTLQEAVDMI